MGLHAACIGCTFTSINNPRPAQFNRNPDYTWCTGHAGTYDSPEGNNTIHIKYREELEILIYPEISAIISFIF